MNESKLFKSLVATFVVAGLGAPTIVLATTSSHLETEKISVSYADLNLKNEEGVRVLYQRLQSASKKACSVTSMKIRSIPRWSRITQCYREVLAETVEKIDNDDLTRVHAG